MPDLFWGKVLSTYLLILLSIFKLLFWNCQGSGHPRFHKIKEYDRELKLNCVALFEIRISGHWAETVIAKLVLSTPFE